MENKCYKCLSIERDNCPIKDTCIYYNKENLEKEIMRRLIDRACYAQNRVKEYFDKGLTGFEI
jgi:hypothetical protein